jgi:hypothetical protein
MILSLIPIMVVIRESPIELLLCLRSRVLGDGDIAVENVVDEDQVVDGNADDGVQDV